jgi:hypothetical protein
MRARDLKPQMTSVGVGSGIDGHRVSERWQYGRLCKIPETRRLVVGTYLLSCTSRMRAPRRDGTHAGYRRSTRT